MSYWYKYNNNVVNLEQFDHVVSMETKEKEYKKTCPFKCQVFFKDYSISSFYHSRDERDKAITEIYETLLKCNGEKYERS